MLTEKEIAIFKNVSIYADKTRWESYRNQITEVLSKDFESILIIGVGDGVVPLVIKHCIAQKNQNTRVYTLDNEEALNPDIVGDIRDVKKLTSHLKIDCILCCQVLEHIEFHYIEQILKDFSTIAQNVIISLPHSRRSIFKLNLKIPKFKQFNIEILIPKKFQGIKVHKYHHWEVGRWGECHSVKNIETMLKKDFIISKKFHVPDMKYHLFYVLETR